VDIAPLISRYDTSGYLSFLTGFADQIEDAAGMDIPVERQKYTGIAHVAVTGMGGSACGGALLRSLYADEIPVPVSVIRDYRLPACVSRSTLVVASSYSGNTEETIAAYRAARERGAQCVCVTAGGALAREAKEACVPVVFLPPGYQPRAAVGYSLIALIGIVIKTGLLPDKHADIAGAAAEIRRLNESFSPENAAGSAPLNLAGALRGKIPVVYTGPAPFDALGMRWRCQFAENAKVLAFSNSLPEMNHNEIMGWDKDHAPGKSVYAVFLRDAHEQEAIRRRFEITREIVERHAAGAAEVWSTGTGRLARVMSLLFYGDYASYYLALLNGKDPMVIGNINDLKRKMAKL